VVNLLEFRQKGIKRVRLLAALATEGKFNYAADLQRGTLGRWLGAQEFSQVLELCAERTIEVFWKTSLARAG
jgi:hypothetical protein